MTRVLLLAAALLPAAAFAQYDAPKKAPSGLPPFLAKMQRHDISMQVTRRYADGTTRPAAAGLATAIRILAGGARVKEYPSRTDAYGRSEFVGVPSNPEVQAAITYQAYVIADGVRFPFNLDAVPTDASEVQVTVPEVTTELDGVTLEHGFIEMFPDEEALVVRHEMRLAYSGKKAVNLGALPGGGLKIPIATGGKHPSLHDEHDPQVEVRGTDLIFKGAILPGGEPAKFTVVYSVPYDTPVFEWSQAVPVPASVGVVVVSKDRQRGHRAAFPLAIEKRMEGGQLEESQLQGGRKFQLLRGQGIALAPGQPLRFAVTQLPVPTNYKPYVLILAIIGVVLFVLFGFRRMDHEGTRMSRTHLIEERDRLVRALARMRRAKEKGRMTETRFEREREAITARLVSLYRALDRLESAR